MADLHSHIGLQIPEAHLEMYNSGSSTRVETTDTGAKPSSHAFSCDGTQTGSQVGKDEKFPRPSTDMKLWPANEGRTNVRVEHDPTFTAETGSHASDGSEQMIIRQTRGWDVRYENQ